MNSRIGTIATEYLAGLIGGTLLGGVAYLFGEFGLRLLAGGAWSSALLSLVAITLLTVAVVVGVGEPIYRLGRKSHPEWGSRARKELYKGAFLGTPAVIALLSLMEMDWGAIMMSEHPFIVIRILLLLVGAIQFVATAPIRLLVYTLNIPAEVVMVLAMPVGAVLIRHLARPESFLDASDEAVANENEAHEHAPNGN
ncbi:MAG: hypothetical protein O3A46_15965 [Candidatus Poribacteria bacterium]|nr:hypothetical protein [Candidatus Poribacteria bacterium]